MPSRTERQTAAALMTIALLAPFPAAAQSTASDPGRDPALPGMILRLDPRVAPMRPLRRPMLAETPPPGPPLQLRLAEIIRKPPPQGQAPAGPAQRDPVMATLFGAVMVLFLMPFVILILRIVRLRNTREQKLARNAPVSAGYVDSFREHLQTIFGKPLRARCTELQRADGYLHESGFYVLGHRHPGQAPQIGFSGIGLIASGAAVLPERFTYGAEIYAAGSLRLGARAVVGAILAEDDLRFGPGASVLRWAHANRIRTEPRAMLRGHVTAETLLQVDAGCQFERLEAGRIEFGPHGRKDGVDGDPARRSGTHGARTRTRDPANHPIVQRAMVALLEDQAAAHTGRAPGDGGAVTAGAAYDATEIAAGTHLKGNMTAPRLLLIRAGAVLGSPREPAFVSAPSIRVEPGVVVFGTIWAREGGVVLGLN